MASSRSTNLSGGQMQRLAVYVFRLQLVGFRACGVHIMVDCRSRTFMRSVVSDDSGVGLLLFDEPSASLDPTAEHGNLLCIGHVKHCD